MNRSTILLSVLVLAGCAHEPAMEQVRSVAPVGPAESLFGELPVQELKQGECALVLWSRKSPSVRFLMALNEPAIARVQMHGHMLQLLRTAQSGQPIYGQYSDQQYRGEGTSLSVNLSTDDRTALNGGAVVSAVVEFMDVQGWMTVIPAAGLIACQP